MLRVHSKWALFPVLSGLVLLGGTAPSVFAAQPPAELVQDLEREVAPSADARCPDASLYSVARPDPPGEPTLRLVLSERNFGP